jgi:hypothetical protein
LWKMMMPWFFYKKIAALAQKNLFNNSTLKLINI